MTAPSFLQVTPTTGMIYLTWGTPTVSRNCDVHYVASFYLNDQLVANGTTDTNQYIFPHDTLPPCSVATLRLKAISDEAYESEAIISELSTGKSA